MTFSFRYTLLFALFTCLAQTSLLAQTPIGEAVRSADIMPSLAGCEPKLIDDCTQGKLTEFISANIKTPDAAKTQGAGGLVMVEFVVEKNGKIGEVRTLHDPGFGLGEEAIRVIKLMNEKKMDWSPAREGGKKVAFRYITPVAFNMAAPPRELPKKTMESELPAAPKVYDVVDVMPTFAGCVQGVKDTIDCSFMKILNHIKTNLQYPEEAKTLAVQGPVVVDFVVDSTGHVIDPVVKKGLGHGTDEEALRVISMMPEWTPGIVAGKHVAVRMTIPILFMIPKEKE